MDAFEHPVGAVKCCETHYNACGDIWVTLDPARSTFNAGRSVTCTGVKAFSFPDAGDGNANGNGGTVAAQAMAAAPGATAIGAIFHCG